MFLCSLDVFHHYGNDWPLFRNWILYPIISATVFCLIGLAKMIESLRKVFATIWGMDIKESLTLLKNLLIWVRPVYDEGFN
jgi:hypothetical protein